MCLLVSGRDVRVRDPLGDGLLMLLENVKVVALDDPFHLHRLVRNEL